MNPVILFRTDLDSENEFDTCCRYISTVNFRTQTYRSLVIGRYSVLPFYKELEDELARNGSCLINSYKQHKWIADIRNWCNLIDTPKTYDKDWDLLPEGSYIVKGLTNSRKHSWSTMMFAPTKKDVPIVASRLLSDTFISEQGLAVREYVPLYTFDVGINFLPVTNEYRTFWINWGGQLRLLSIGFYWSSFPEYKDERSHPLDTNQGEQLLWNSARIISQHCNFFTIDVAQKDDGNWIVIEINDGQMSGLSMIEPDQFYKTLGEVLDGR